MKNLIGPLAAISTLAAIALVVSTGAGASPEPGEADVFGNTVFAATYVSTGEGANVRGDVVSGTYLTTGASSTITGNTESGTVTTLGAGATVLGSVVSAGTVLGAGASAGTGLNLLTTPVDGSAQLAAAQSDLNGLAGGIAQGLGDVPAGITYSSGVYDITGLRTYTADTTIVLDANGTDDDFVFNVSNYITFGAGVKVVMANLPESGPAPQVFWNAGGYISIGAGANILGTVIAKTYVSTGAFSTVNGPGGECGGAVYSQSSYVSVGAGASIGGGGGPCQAVLSPNITAAKNVVAGPTYDAGTDSYSISYEIVVENNGSGPGTYDVSENPTFGAGTTITSVTLDGNALALPIVNPVINDAVIAAGATTTHNVIIVFDVDTLITATARDCILVVDETGTGTLNSVTVTPNIGVSVDGQTCGQVPSPGIGVTKTAPNAPVQVGATNQYTVDYTITVTNTGGNNSYSLVDTPVFGGGATIDSLVLIAPIPVVANQTFGLGNYELAPAGTSRLADASEVFNVRATFTVDPTTTADERDCTTSNGAGTGTLNSVTVTPADGAPSSDVACTSISSPNITAAKNVVAGPTYNAGTDSYSISYEIVVENNGSGPGTYDVSENPTFGAGTTITSVTLDGNALALPIVNPVINDAVIAAGATTTHNVIIVFDVDTLITATARDCILVVDETGTGTLNSVTVTPNIGVSADGQTCGQVPSPGISVDKRISSPATDNGDGTYAVVYSIDVVNAASAVAGEYDLADIAAFSPDLTVESQTVINTAPGSITTDPAFLDTGTIVTGETILAGDTHTYEVTVVAAIAAETTASYVKCSSPTGVAGEGLYNEAALTVEGATTTSNVCGDIPATINLTLLKPVCINSAPFIEYSIESSGFAPSGTATVTFYDLDGNKIETRTLNALTGTMIYPGASVDAEGNATDWPGWKLEGGAWLPDSTDDAWLSGLRVVIEVNPTAEGIVDYPATITPCAGPAGDLTMEKSDGGADLQVGDGPFGYTLTVANVGGTSTGDRVTVTDELPAEFAWVSFPDTAGSFPLCTQAGQVLTCELDPTLVDQAGESTSFVVTAQAREGIAPSVEGYRNLSYVDSPLDPAPTTPSCTDTDNNVGCDETPVRPAAVLTKEPVPTVPQQGLPATGSSGLPNTLGLATLLVGLGAGLTLIVRRRKQTA